MRRRLGAAAGGALGAFTAHTAWLMSQDSFNTRQAARNKCAYGGSADPIIARAALVIRDELAKVDCLVVSGPGAALAARDAVHGMPSVTTVKVVSELHENLAATVERLRFNATLSTSRLPSAALAAAIAQSRALPPLTFLQERLTRCNEAVLCVAQQQLEDEASRHVCVAAARMPHCRVCIIADEKLYAAEYCESLLRREEVHSVGHLKLSLPRGADALLRAQCYLPKASEPSAESTGSQQHTPESGMLESEGDTSEGDTSEVDTSEEAAKRGLSSGGPPPGELAQWLVDSAGTHIPDLIAVATAADAAEIVREESTGAARGEADAMDEAHGGTRANPAGAGAGANVAVSAPSAHDLLRAGVDRCVEQKRRALETCFGLDGSEENGTRPMGLWAWAWLREMSQGSTPTAGLANLSSVMGPAVEVSRAERMLLSELLDRLSGQSKLGATRADDEPSAAELEVLDAGLADADTMIAHGVLQLDFVPVAASVASAASAAAAPSAASTASASASGGVADSSNHTSDGDGDGGPVASGQSTEGATWETHLVVSPLTAAAYQRLSSDPRMCAVMDGRLQEAYRAEDLLFLEEDKREVDEGRLESLGRGASAL